MDMALTTWMQHVPLMVSGYHRDMLEKIGELRQHETIYPPEGRVLFALACTPFEQVKIVIVGQDPYHGPGQAHGLAFSVPVGVKAPPSLRNIFKEVARDAYGLDEAEGCTFSTDLSRWAEQGVLLLNASLTVAAGQAGSHRDLGWAVLTDAFIRRLSELRSGLVFMLWGRFAQSKARLIDSDRHLTLEAPHPSPLSAYRGFFGCGHFSKANAYLTSQGKSPITW